ncbi:MAG TPA: hypothetical protein VE177_00570, partial [Candidatus Binatus sp.]|nr:hypothetical protein [Candidatus Binatus sp.]
YDPLTGITTTFDYDPTTDTTYVGREGDVEGILELNKFLASDPDYTKKGIKESFWHCASIPNLIIEKWLNEDGINVYNRHHWPRIRKKLLDPEYRYLRTTTKSF